MPHVIENVVCTLATADNRTGLRCDCQGQPICGSCSSTSTSTESISAVSEQSSAARSSTVESSAATSTECVERPCSPEWQTVIGSRTDRCWLFTVPGAVDELTCFCWKWESATQPDELVITDLDTGLVVYDSGCVGTQGMTPEVCYTKLGPQRYMVYVNADCAHTGGVTVFEFLWKCACSSAQPQPSSETASTPSQTQSSAYVSTPSQDIPSTGSQTQESNVIFVECSSSMSLNIKFKDCATHTMPVVLPPNQAGTAQVVKINGICYQRVGLTADPAQELLVEGVFTDCVTCAGSSAAGSPTSSAQGSSAASSPTSSTRDSSAASSTRDSSTTPSTPIPPGPSSAAPSSTPGSSTTQSSAPVSSAPATSSAQVSSGQPSGSTASCTPCTSCQSSYDIILSVPSLGYSALVEVPDLTEAGGECVSWHGGSLDNVPVNYDNQGIGYAMAVNIDRESCHWICTVEMDKTCQNDIPGNPVLSYVFDLGTSCVFPGTFFDGAGNSLQLGTGLTPPVLNDVCRPTCCEQYRAVMHDGSLGCILEYSATTLDRVLSMSCSWVGYATQTDPGTGNLIDISMELEKCSYNGTVSWVLKVTQTDVVVPSRGCSHLFTAGNSACPPSSFSNGAATVTLTCVGTSSTASAAPSSATSSPVATPSSTPAVSSATPPESSAVQSSTVLSSAPTSSTTSQTPPVPAPSSSAVFSSTAPSSAQPSLSGDSTCAQMGQPGCTSTAVFTAFSDTRPEFFTAGVFTATAEEIAAYYMATSYPPDYPALCATGSPCAYTVGPWTRGNANGSPPYGVAILLDVTICCGCC